MKKSEEQERQHDGCPYRHYCNRIIDICPYLYQRNNNRSLVK